MSTPKKILFVSHDANRAGAQLFLLSVMLHLKSKGHQIILLVINDWGDLNDTFNLEFNTFYLNKHSSKKKNIFELLSPQTSVLEKIKSEFEIDFIYVNTIASVDLLPELKRLFKKPIVTHIHELSYSISQFGSKNALNYLFEDSDRIIACSNAVAQNLLKTASKPENITVIHSFVDNKSILEKSKISDSNRIKDKYNLKGEYTWIVACGNADWRKAPDIFVQIVHEALKLNPNFRFAWIGIKEDDPLCEQLKYDAERFGIREKIVWISPTPEAVEIINALDIFLICSREDPFPLVVLEAALCSKPIIGFKNTGGADEFIENDCGLQAPYLDVFQISACINSLGKEKIKNFGANAKSKVLERYSFEKSILKIENLLNSL